MTMLSSCDAQRALRRQNNSLKTTKFFRLIRLVVGRAQYVGTLISERTNRCGKFTEGSSFQSIVGDCMWKKFLVEKVLPVSIGVILSIVVLWVGFLVLNKSANADACTAWHVYECEEAHKRNLTFAYCSGFTYPAKETDEATGCTFPPWRNCSEVPKGCILDSGFHYI